MNRIVTNIFYFIYFPVVNIIIHLDRPINNSIFYLTNNFNLIPNLYSCKVEVINRILTNRILFNFRFLFVNSFYPIFKTVREIKRQAKAFLYISYHLGIVKSLRQVPKNCFHKGLSRALCVKIMNLYRIFYLHCKSTNSIQSLYPIVYNVNI